MIQLYGFSSIEDPEAVKRRLEQDTGEGTVCDVVFGDYMIKSRAHAKVQFIDSESAETVKSLADQRQLWYGDSYLKARDLNTDILCSMDDVTMHLGCLVSKEKFSVLWEKENVRVEFGEGLRTLYLYLSHDSVDYKLELSYENIWQIVLHRPRDLTSKFLLLQVCLLKFPSLFNFPYLSVCSLHSLVSYLYKHMEICM